MEPRKGKRQSLKALLELRDLVLSGALPAGERLYEVSISQRIGISRTPVREALAMLAQEGLLERVPSGGFTVRTFSFQDVIDSIELRGVLEGTAARLAAERGVDAARLDEIYAIVDALDDVVKAGAQALNFALYTDLNGKFHTCLAGLSGSEIIQGEVARAVRLPFASPSAFLDAQFSLLEIRQTLISAQAQHRDMIDAIAGREGARAEHIAREHARLARKNLEYVMKHDPSLMEKVPGLKLVAG